MVLLQPFFTLFKLLDFQESNRFSINENAIWLPWNLPRYYFTICKIDKKWCNGIARCHKHLCSQGQEKYQTHGTTTIYNHNLIVLYLRKLHLGIIFNWNFSL